MKNTKVIQKTVKLTAVGAIVLSSMVQPLSIIATASEVATKAETRLLTSTDVSIDATTAVKNLFIDNDLSRHIKGLTDQADVNAAKALVNAVPDATQKASLLESIEKAQKDVDNLANAVVSSPVYTEATSFSGTKGTANGQIVFKVYDATGTWVKAQKVVGISSSGTFGANLDGWATAAKQGDPLTGSSTIQLVAGDKVQAGHSAMVTIQSRYQNALDAVKELFINNDLSKHIKGLTDQADVNAAKALVNAVTDATQKASLLESIEKAQKDVDNLANAVVSSPVYTDTTSFSGTKGTVNGQIVFKVYDATGTWVKAQKVVGISDSGTFGANLDGWATAAKQGDPLTGSSTIQLVAGDKVQAGHSALVTIQPSDPRVVDAVNQLFIDNDTTKNIKTTTTQAMIDAAATRVLTVVDTTIKTKLTEDIRIANDLLELRSGVYKGWELDGGKLIFKVDAEKQKKFNLVMYKNGGHIGTFHYGDTKVFEIKTVDGIMNAISNAGFVDGDKIKVNYVFDYRAYTIDEFTINLAYSAANKAVKELFINNDLSKHIKGLTNQADVDAAKALVNAVTDATQKASLLESIEKAQKDVDNLANAVVSGPVYTDATSLTGTKGTANGQIVFKVYDATGTWIKAQKVVEISDSGTFSANLEGWATAAKQGDPLTGSSTIQLVAGDKVQAGHSALVTIQSSDQRAVDAVNQLFIDNDATKNIKTTTTQAMIDAAEVKVATVTDAAIKTKLTEDIRIANDLLELRSGVYKGWELDGGKLIFKVDAEKQKKFNLVMYKNGGHIGTFHYGNTLVFEITTANGIMSAISNAGFVDGDKIKVNYVYNNRAYTIDEFTINIAYSAANKAVKELFIDNDISKHIKGLTDQANVDAAKALVNAVTDATQKAKLLESIEKAQKDVDNLANLVVTGPIYTDATSFIGTRGEANGQIVFKVYDSTGTWVKAQKVVGTSSSGTFGANLEGWATAAKQGDPLTGSSTIQLVAGDKVQAGHSALVTIQSSDQRAVDAVNQLFIDNNSTKNIKPATTQAMIDAAEAKVATVTDVAIKTKLTEDIKIANDLLELRSGVYKGWELQGNKLVFKVDAEKQKKFNLVMYKNGGHIGTFHYGNTMVFEIKTVDGIMNAISNAGFVDGDKIKVNYVYNNRAYTIDEFEINYGAQARIAINTLFVDDNPAKAIKDTTKQASIDAAQALVDHITDATKKEELQKDIDKAQKELNNKEALVKAAVDNLFINNDITKHIKGLTDQAALDAAKALVNTIADETHKTALLENIEKAQKEFDAFSNAVANPTYDTDKVVWGKQGPGSGEIVFKIYDVTGTWVKAQKVVSTTAGGVFSANLDGWSTASSKGAPLTGSFTIQLVAGEKIQAGRSPLVTIQSAYQLALDATKQLFIDNDPTKSIKDTTNQAAIDAAQALVNNVTDTTKKGELQKNIDKAQKELNEKSAVIAKPTVNTVTNNDTAVKGTGTPGLTITVVIGTNTYTGEVATNGTFSITIPLQKADTVLTVTQKKGEKVSDPVSVKVANYIPATAPVVNTVGPFQQAITGKVPEGTKMVRLLVNGIAQRTAVPEADGSFSFYSRFITDGISTNIRLVAGDTVTVDYGNKTPANLVTNVTVSAELVKPIVNDVLVGADYVTGLAPVGTQVLRLVVNGKAQRTVTPQANIDAVTAGGIGADGRFKIYCRIIVDETGVSRKLKAGDRVTVDSGVQIPGDTGTTVLVK
ncbi:hypothetical protein HCA78_14330 [Listeria booriae]|uniref:Bacterial Ig domain-containing protein n=1 Tax=Listeria booriae TaxID=1552123 RepID=A0A842CVV2_9LIST|nr:toxin Cry1Ac domain D-VI-related protein [Listeria booriae]MBC2004959.1 hypothetical protein [Listeria booriae]